MTAGLESSLNPAIDRSIRVSHSVVLLYSNPSGLQNPAMTTVSEPITLHESSMRAVTLDPSRTALMYRGDEYKYRRISYREVSNSVNTVARAMSALGIGKGDRVAILSYNRPEWIIADLAIMKIGAIVVPIYHTLSPSAVIHILSDKEILAGIVAATNERLRTELPNLKEQQAVLKKDLSEVKATADGLINQWATLASEDGARFLKEKLDALGKRRGQIEESLASIEVAMSRVEGDTVDQELVAQALADFSNVFAGLKPYQQKDLLRLVLQKAILGPDYLKIALYGRPPEIVPLAEGDSRFQTLEW